MRFYWFDGKAPQGPFEIEALLAQPGFHAESVVCPVGAERPEDWKPAVNFEPLRDALFKPRPALVSPPPPVLSPCPSCRHKNTDDAVFCNHCGHPLQEAPATTAQAPSPAVQAQQPAPQPTATSPTPPAPEPAQPHFGLLPGPVTNPLPDPLAPPTAPARGPMLPIEGPSLPKPPEVSAGPKRGSAPGKMGRIGQLQDQQKKPEPTPQAAPVKKLQLPASPPPPQPAKTVPPASAKKSRPVLLAVVAFCLTGTVLAGIFFLRQSAPAKIMRQVHLAPPPAAKLATQEGSPMPAAKQPQAAPAVVPAPTPAPPPVVQAQEPAPQPATLKPVRKRRRKKNPAAVSLPQSPEQAAAATPEPAAAQPASADQGSDKELLLPGIPKKVHPASAKPAAVPAQPESSDGAAAPAAGQTDQLLADSAKEQFNFCHQLMGQGAFGDFFDTCLCAAVRNATPYKGQRRVFVEKSSQDPASELGSSFEIADARVAGQTATITAKWNKPSGAEQRSEKWAIEDGLWCRTQ